MQTSTLGSVPCKDAWLSALRYSIYEEVQAAVVCSAQSYDIDDSDRSEARQ